MTGLLRRLRASPRPDLPLTRAKYLTAGLTLAAVKYAGDAGLVYVTTGLFWSPLAYLHSLPYLLSPEFSHTPRWLLPAMALWALPFIAIGVVLTVRRAVDAGRTPWVALWFFVPYANYLLMIALCLWPSANSHVGRAARLSVDSRLAGSLRAVAVGLSVGLAMVGVAAYVARDYGAPLFLGAPYVMGALTAFVLNRRRNASWRETAWVTVATFVVTGGALLLVAIEGLICVLMAFPPAIATGWLGALLGRRLATGGFGFRRGGVWSLIALPTALMIDPFSEAGRSVHEVRSAIEIAASPEHVWTTVIAFSPLPPPTDLVFRSGIAFPMSARIDGAGVGAVRHCVFSTGAFVEPITHWEPGRRLSFDVVASPAPLRELSPYSDLAPAHLDGYLRSLRGEFRLMPTPAGTRLEGSTWYQIDMAPEGYWQLWADALIHRIHLRVLDHVKAQAEAIEVDRRSEPAAGR